MQKAEYLATTHEQQGQSNGERVVEEKADVVGAAKQGVYASYAIRLQHKLTSEEEILRQTLQSNHEGRTEQSQQQTGHILPRPQTVASQQQEKQRIKHFLAKCPQRIPTRIGNYHRYGGSERENKRRYDKRAESIPQFPPREPIRPAILFNQYLYQSDSSTDPQDYFYKTKLIVAVDRFLKIEVRQRHRQERNGKWQPVPAKQGKNQEKRQRQQRIEMKKSIRTQIIIADHIIAGH